MATTQELLDQALAAQHALLTGTARVSVGYGDRKVEYTRATLNDLTNYIAQLRRQLNGVPTVRNRIGYVVPD